MKSNRRFNSATAHPGSLNQVNDGNANVDYEYRKRLKSLTKYRADETLSDRAKD